MKTRIVFMGSADFSSIVLESLVQDERFEIVSVFTQPDKPVGRKAVITPPDTALCAKRLSLPLRQPLKISDETEYIASLKPDFIIVAAYGQILKKPLLAIAPCINLHTSFLPNNRGAAALQTHILHGYEYTGVTAIRMDSGLDTGNIVGVIYFRPEGCAKFGCLLKYLGFLGANLLKSILPRFNDIQPLRQIEADATYAAKLGKKDGELSLCDAQKTYRRFLAFQPWPGVYVKSNLKLKELEINSTDGTHKAGEIIEIQKDGVVIGCTKGSLKITIVQAPSKNEMNAVDYIRGKRLQVGDILV